MSPFKSVSLIKLCLPFLLGLGLFTNIGCSKHHLSPLKSDRINEPEYTGFLKINERNQIIGDYLIPNPSPDTEKLKKDVINHWDITGAENISLQFSQSLIETSAFVNLEEKNIKFTFKFHGNLLQGERTLVVPIVNSNKDTTSGFTLSETAQNDLKISSGSECLDTQCTQINLKLSLIRSEGDNTIEVASTGIHYSNATVWIKSYLPQNLSNDDFDTNFFRLAKTLTQAKPFLGQEFQVVGGLSKTYISMNLESDRFCLNFENSETLIEPIQVYSNCPQQEEHIKTLVVSNYHVRSPTDSKLLSLKTLLQLKQTTNSRRRVYLEISRSPWAVNESNDVDLQPVNLVETKLAQYFIPVNIKNPRVMEITKGFEKYRNSTWVQQAIQQQLKQRQQGIQNFFINIQSPLPRLQRLCEQSELPCTLLYILLSESSMFSAKAHEYEKSRIGGSCEVGPWQITYSTGKYILSEDRVQKIKYKKTADDINGQTPSKCSSKIPQCSSSNPSHCYKINENDDRQYLIPATKAALNYFNILFKSFKDDPALAILAYNRGPGSVDRWLSIEIAHDLNFGLHQLIKRKVPGSDYAKRFLAYYFIGADIEKYGLSIENPKAEIPCEWLYNPRSKKCGQP